MVTLLVETSAGKDLLLPTFLSIRFADPALALADLSEISRSRDGNCCEIKPYYYHATPF